MKTTRAQPGPKWFKEMMAWSMKSEVFRYSSVYKVLSLIYIVIHGGKQWLFEDIGRGNQTYHGSPFF